MLSKLAFKNVGKSLKDYSIYFLTLVFGVCVFYMFNSIEAQQKIMDVTEMQVESMEALSHILSYISVFVSVVLGFLIVYANSFLIRRRKKELGIYMTLGMEKQKISTILVLETSVIAITALVVGLLSGVFLSHVMSLFTAKMFEANMSSFKFIFSTTAAIKSILYFSFIFIVVIFFNTITISKYKLIDLIYGGRKNEKLRIKNITMSVFVFILAIICLGTAYFLILKNGIENINLIFLLSIILGSIGTLLFFMSLSGFLIKVIQQNKKVYLKNLNMFVLRQINSKINTNFISMSVVCIVLLLTIGTFSTGSSLASVLSGNLKSKTPYDISLVKYFSTDGDNNTNKTDDNLLLEIDKKTQINKYTKFVHEFTIYRSDINLNSIIDEDMLKDNNNAIATMPIEFLSLSDYNKIAESQGQTTLELTENEYAISSNFDSMKDAVKKMIDQKKSLVLNGSKYIPVNKQPVSTFVTQHNNYNVMTVIINDSLVSKYSDGVTYINANFKDEESGKKLVKALKDYDKNCKNEEKAYTYFISKEAVYQDATSSKAIIAFLSIYLGFVFLITCAAILSLQQLSEASDNKERYNLLKKIGVDKKMIKHSLFIQILIYFVMPLALAVVHSYVGIKAVNNVLVQVGKVNIYNSILLTAGFVILIYGSYFIATYIGSKNIINKQ